MAAKKRENLTAQVVIRLRPRQLKRLERLAAREGMIRAEAARTCMELGIDKLEGDPKEAEAAPKRRRSR